MTMEKLSINSAQHKIMLSEWETRVVECRNSGKTIKEWCLDRGVSIHSYFYWQRLVWEKEAEELRSIDKSRALASVQFAQIDLGNEKKQYDEQSKIILEYKDWSIEIGNEANLDLVRQIIQMVGQHV